VVKPRLRLRKRQFVGSNTPEDGQVGAPNALWVWKLARQTARQHIQDTLLFLDGITLFDQTRLSPTLLENEQLKFTAGRVLGLPARAPTS
jgi:hypothetical protein